MGHAANNKPENIQTVRYGASLLVHALNATAEHLLPACSLFNNAVGSFCLLPVGHH